MLSYKEIIKANEDFAGNHYVIQNFGAGERWQVTSHDQNASFKYPLMWMEDLPNPYSSNEYVYSFRIWFVTRVEPPKDRQNDLLFAEFTEAKNTMIKCAQDLISSWVQDVNYPEIEFSQSGSIEPFTDQEPDVITGCWVDVQFRTAFTYDSCLIPSSGSTPPSPTCDPATIRINDTPFTSAASGTTENIVVKDTGGTEVGSESGGEWIVPSAGNNPVSTTFNGVATGVDTPAGDALAIAAINTTPAAVGTLITDTANAKGILIANADMSLEGVPFATGVAAEGSMNIEIVDSSDVTVPSTVIIDGAGLKKIEVAAALNTANLNVTGITASVRTGDDGDLEEGRGSWYGLGYTNPYSHAFRFTGNTGGYTDGTNWFDVSGVATTYALAFPDDECLDWKYYDQVNGTVPMWYLKSIGTTTPSPALPRGGQVGGKSANTAITEALASTQNGYTDWYLCNVMEFISIIYWAQNINSNQGLNYKPFEFDPTVGSPAVSGFRLVTSSLKDTSNGSYWVSDNGVIAFANPATSAYGYFMKRNATLTDLGL